MNYENFAADYDKLVYDIDYKKIVEFINKKIKENNISGINLMEIGSGTGNITSLLDGYNIIAVEKSEEMILIAREKFSFNRNIRFINSDITNLEIARKFDIVISVLDVFNYIIDIKELKKSIENIYNHMEEGSILIFDINSEYKIKEFIGNNIFTDEIEDTLYIWQGEYDDNSRINNYKMTFFRELENGLYERYDEDHFEKAYSVEEISKILSEVGFINIETFDDYSDKKIDDKTMRVTFVAIKE